MRSHRTRATAQKTLNAIWVTDDVLAEALTRFSLVSQAHRRHGSHVPGPLEAQRRLAKRRMGIAAMGPTGPASPGMDWWAGLFGFGGRGAPVDYEKSWKWEPPRIRDLPFMRTNYEPALATAMGDFELSAAVETETSTATDSVILTEAAGSIETSKAKFQKLLDNAGDTKTVDSHAMDRFLQFLRSSDDESPAKNTAALVKWLKGRTVSSSEIEKLDEAIVEKIKLETMSELEIRYILVALTRQEVENYEARVFSIFQSAGIMRMTSVIDVTTFALFAKTSTDRGRIINYRRVEKWLNAVHGFYASIIPDFDHQLWRRLYGNVFRYTNPEHIIGHLGRLNWYDLVIILLRSRTPFLEANRSHFTCTNDGYLRLLDHQAVSREPTVVEAHTDTAKLDKLLERYKFLQSFRPTPTNTNIEDLLAEDGIQAIVDSLITMKEEGLPYELMCEDIFAIVNAAKAGKTMDELWKCIRRHEELDVTEKVVHTMIERFREEGTRGLVFRAGEIFKQYPRLNLSHYPELPLKLIEHGYGRPCDIFPLFHRRPAGQPILDQSIEILHLTAYKWACSKRISNRNAFTRVWECYRYLQDRQIPLRPLMSRAIVQAGVTRYLISGQRVPITQAKYVCTIVEQCEGTQAARDLDRIIWRIWTGDLTAYRGQSQIEQWKRGLNKTHATEAVEAVKAVETVKAVESAEERPWYKAWGKLRANNNFKRGRQERFNMRMNREVTAKSIQKEAADRKALEWLEKSQTHGTFAKEAERKQ